MHHARTIAITSELGFPLRDFPKETIRDGTNHHVEFLMKNLNITGVTAGCAVLAWIVIAFSGNAIIHRYNDIGIPYWGWGIIFSLPLVILMWLVLRLFFASNGQFRWRLAAFILSWEVARVIIYWGNDPYHNDAGAAAGGFLGLLGLPFGILIWLMADRLVLNRICKNLIAKLAVIFFTAVILHYAIVLSLFAGIKS